MHRTIRSVLVVIAVFGLVAAACSSDDNGGNTGTTGGATGSTSSGGPIWVLLPDSASSAAGRATTARYFDEAFKARLSTLRTNIVNAEGDAATQQSQAEQAIADGASVIVLDSIDTGSGATIIDYGQGRRTSRSSSTTASTRAAPAARRT